MNTTGQKVLPAKGEQVFRMSDEKLQDKDGNDLPNTSGNIVKFKVEYSKDHEGKGVIKGHPYYGLKDNSVHDLHIIHAEALQEKGLGKIVK